MISSGYHRNDDEGKQKMMASREVYSVTPFLYAFKRWFTFSGRTSALPDILTTVQSYEHFLKYAIGNSLFVIQFRNCNTLAWQMYYMLEVVDHRTVKWALQGFCRAARTIFYVFTQ